MARGIDHVVHVVHDLDAAVALYRSLGFQVGVRNRHPRSWGTQNHIIQLHGSFVELLTVAEPAQIAPHAPRFFSFGAFNRDALARGQGLSMLVLEGGDPQADAREFREAGIGDFNVFDFEREGKRPDGTAIKVAFSLAFARDSNAADIGFFTCRHRYPENFWNPSFQIHANTTEHIAGVVMVAGKPSEHYAFLSTLTGEREVFAAPSGLTVTTPRGEIQVMVPIAFEDYFEVPPPDTSGGAQLAALRFAVRDLDALDGVMSNAAVAANKRNRKLIVAPQSALGATLVFEAIRDGAPLR
jgi:catechol 2,3-dioxygenase-like lactoylglutathione lyase family enzyme